MSTAIAQSRRDAAGTVGLSRQRSMVGSGQEYVVLPHECFGRAEIGCISKVSAANNIGSRLGVKGNTFVDSQGW